MTVATIAINFLYAQAPPDDGLWEQAETDDPAQRRGGHGIPLRANFA